MKKTLLEPPFLKVALPADLPFFETPVSIVSCGSCFASETSELLSESSFDVMDSPNGILYNPYSIKEAMQRAACLDRYREDELFFHDGKWHLWSHHGSFSSSDKRSMLEKVNSKLEEFNLFSKNAALFIVTFSSSVVYILNGTGAITANCHKVPGNLFTRRLLSQKECSDAVRETSEAVFALNRNAKIIYTVSPVRHYPGDLILNSRSKALLATAIHEECSARDGSVSYFPAFEILNDELRDYRFYNEDMTHPSPLAVKIITDRFIERCFGNEALEKAGSARRLAAASKHIKKELC